MLPIRTYGLTHLDVAVRDPERTMAFYASVLGLAVYRRLDEEIVAVTPDAHDLIGFKRAPERAGVAGGIAHFGFRVRDVADIDEILRRAAAAGGTVVARAEVGPGKPYGAFRDLDGYEVEVYGYEGVTE
jgi:predicted enzyme related to lactoylglutathione lyase